MNPWLRQIFKNMLEKATGGCFLYKDKLYKQTDGVTMGSPLGPTLANFFLGHLEKVSIFENINCKPKFYVRYVDDIFAVFDDDESKLAFFNHLNSIHPSLRFTMEEGTDRLPFLDTEVRLVDGGVETSLYRKKTHTGVFLMFSAVVPRKWKFGLLFGMFHRAYSICSSPNLFQNGI